MKISVDALRRTLDQQQRRLLLRIVDSSTLKEECGARSAFRRGFRLGSRLIADAFR